MIDRDTLPKPMDAILKTIEDATMKDEERASTFARGLALGLLVGAAIAGSTIWQRRQAANARREAGRTDSAPSPSPWPPHPSGDGRPG
jgi:hypothetical protein